MLCFEVFINGEKKCTAGVGEFGVLHCGILWANRIHPEDIIVEDTENGEIYVSGMEDYDSNRSESVKWLTGRVPLASGDEMLVRVVDSNTPDPPAQRGVTVDPDMEEKGRQARRRIYEKLKREFEGE